jgi:hypothetical protein
VLTERSYHQCLLKGLMLTDLTFEISQLLVGLQLMDVIADQLEVNYLTSLSGSAKLAETSSA